MPPYLPWFFFGKLQPLIQIRLIFYIYLL